MAEVRIAVDLDANQATQVAGKLSQVLAQASINGARIQVGNPEQVDATTQAATDLNQVLKQIYISIQKVNIALAKTGKQQLMANSGLDVFKTKTGRPNKAFNDLMKGFDNAIKSSEQAIQNINSKFVPAVETIQPAAEQAKESIQKIGTQSEKSVTKGAAAFTQAGQRVRRFASAVEHIAHSFVSPFTIALVAFEAVVKSFTYFWNNLTESIQKMTTRAQSAIKAVQRKQRAIEEETKASRQLVKQLEDLNKQQNLTIDQQRLAQSIIARLNKQYKDLGITLDETTGKYVGLYQAQRKIDERNRNSQANALKKQIDAQRDVVNAALANTFGRGINLDTMVKGSDFFTLAEKLGATLGAENADMLARKWNTKDLAKQLEVIDQLIQGLSSSDQVIKNAPEAREALATLIDYRKQLQDLNSVDAQIIEANKRLAESFKQFEDAIKKSEQNIKNYEQQLQKLVDNNNYEQASLPERIGLKQSQIDKVDKQIEDNLKKLEELKKQLAESQVYDDTGEAFNQEQRRYNELKKKTSQLEEQYNDKKIKYEQQRNKKLNKLQKERDKLASTPPLPQSTLGPTNNNSYNAQLANINKQIADIDKNDDYKKLNEKLKQLNKSQQKLTAQEVKYQKEKQNQLQLSQQIAQLEEDIAKGRLTREEAAIEAEKLREQYRQEQLEAERKLKQQEDQRNQDYSDFVNGLMRKQVEGLNQIINKKKQNLLLELQLNAEKIRGRKLTEEQIEALKSYVDVMSLQDQFKANQKLELQTNGVITNDLARKGGWASSVVVDRAQDINKEILNVQKSQVSLMQKINDTMSKSNDLLKQFSVIQ